MAFSTVPTPNAHAKAAELFFFSDGPTLWKSRYITQSYCWLGFDSTATAFTLLSNSVMKLNYNLLLHIGNPRGKEEM